MGSTVGVLLLCALMGVAFAGAQAAPTQNLDRSLGLDPDGNLLRTRNRFLNDGRQIFVKVSYLFRF
ncbi:MAG: hypothetical protein ACRD2M_02885 [Terriglobales bacterium]